MVKTEILSSEAKSRNGKELKNAKKPLKLKSSKSTGEKTNLKKPEISDSDNKYKKLIAKKRTISESESKNDAQEQKDIPG